jgi:hypothetical protein
MDEDAIKALERARPITIKFAQLGSDLVLVGDAWEMYEGLFDDLPNGWTPAGKACFDTQSEQSKDVWAFRHGDTEFELIAVEHETGVEFVLMGMT